MAGLAFDQDDQEQRPAKKPRRIMTKKVSGIHITRMAMPAAVAVGMPSAVAEDVHCPMPGVRRGGGGSRQARAMREGGTFLVGVDNNKLYIEVGAINLLLRRIREELTSCGVDSVHIDSSPEKPTISWDFRDEARVFKCRVGKATKTSTRQSVSVRRRIAPGGNLHGLTFEDTRQTVYRDFVAEIGLC